jgi:uncharacterized membrane protein
VDPAGNLRYFRLARASYVVEILPAKYLLHERINRKRWAGALLLTLGVILLAH